MSDHVCTCREAAPLADVSDLHAAVDAMLAELADLVDLAGARMTRYPAVYGTVWAATFAARALLADAAEQLAQVSDRGVKV